jgi:predicted small lipoprotein YifL
MALYIRKVLCLLRCTHGNFLFSIAATRFYADFLARIYLPIGRRLIRAKLPVSARLSGKPQLGEESMNTTILRNTDMNRTKLIPAVALMMLVSLCALTGCEKEGPVEKIGETIDEAAKDTKRAVEDATD